MSRTSTAERLDYKRNVLWIDDFANSYSSLEGGLRALGVNVVVEASVEAVPSIIDQYDCFILDNKMGEQELNYGLNLAYRLAEERPVKIVVFSAYLTRDQTDQLFHTVESTGSVIMYIAKNPIEVNQAKDYFARVCAAIDGFFDGLELERTPFLDGLGVEKLSASSYSYSEFVHLRLADKAEIYKRFQSTVGHDLDKLFEDGAIWVLYFDGESEPEHVAFVPDKIWERDQITRRAESLDRVPFVFRRDLRVDDCRAAGRGGERVGDYPRLALNVDGKNLKFHFDTGADTTLMDERFVTEIGSVRWDSHEVESFRIQTKDHVCQRIEFDALVLGPKASSGFAVTVPAYAVNEWGESDLNIRCSTSCPNVTQIDCIFRRNGLIGRDLYVGRPLRVMISGNEVVLSEIES